METVVFNTIMKNLDDMTTKCQEIKALALRGTEALRALKVEDYNSIITTAQQLHSMMDKIMQNEIYHIIGMGKMNVIQMSKFTASVKKLGECRTAVKSIASLNTENSNRNFKLGDSVYKSELAETVLSVPSEKMGARCCKSTSGVKKELIKEN